MKIDQIYTKCLSQASYFIENNGEAAVIDPIREVNQYIEIAKSKKCKIYGIVGKKNSFTEKNSKITIVVPSFNNKLITPMSEAFQAVIWHSLVSNPELQVKKTKW